MNRDHPMAGTVPITLFEAASMPHYATHQPACDSFGRRIDYLRISLTDRCNMRCVYCMPVVGMQFAPRPELLTNAELLRVVQAAATAGFRKLRLTGGEPTLRQDLVELIRAMKALPGIEHIAMTSNALRLRHQAHQLKAAGLDRVNISIDSLDPLKFRQISYGANLDDVWAGIEAANAAGLHPIKLNAVIVRGLNDDEVVALASLTTRYPWELRFIEVMPLSGVANLAEDGVVSTSELIAHIEAHFGPLQLEEHHAADPARCYRIPGAPGKLGFISAVTDPFCDTCNRMRLTADGRLHLCLLRDNEVDLRAALRNGASQAKLEQIIRHAVYLKPWGHGLPEGVLPTLRGMSELGG
ncbi:GTP 3',8-cyclase MoaA [Candidatus Viridilinea mediisalina]|uniref:GTP 3',8-cyclase n=1 Tax=Candidatus Viridilinea mediisalina TaxID=2024553 RepID=A0A2A6RF97_9CHLR|nr:GTP 3',8-cyclase MoaA [Candidatus Viridilinea mediisalina]PDW01692.1 GTP 3',8-cyclase MoaA [Candidatus Viridilinea mediisalina]